MNAMNARFPSVLLGLALLSLPVSGAWAEEKAKPPIIATYEKHCANCHHPLRLGGVGPALLPENLKRLRADEARQVITGGRAATQMPAFGTVLTAGEIDALVKLVYTPLPTLPTWDMADIRASHVVSTEPKKPAQVADPLNMFLVVELADHHATVLDGDRLEPIHRFQTRFALHGGPKYSPDGRFVYLASRDGWITQYDMHNLRVVAEVRAGINTRNLAISGDGRLVMVANYLPHSLVVLETDGLKPVTVIPAVSAKGESSRVSAVFDAAPRNSFIVALKDIPEAWEIPYTAPFTVRRILLDDYLDDFFFDLPYRHLLGASRSGPTGQVVDLDQGRKVGSIDIPGMPHLSSGIIWDYKETRVMATPNIKEGLVSVVDMKDWRVIKRIPTLGPGFFMRSHEKSPYAWVDVFFGPNKDAVHVIDKATLEIVKTLRPAPGKTSAHVEFTRDGRYALLSIWDPDGAVVIYDGNTLEEIKRLPMKKPSGKYNVYNKITRSSGTSH